MFLKASTDKDRRYKQIAKQLEWAGTCHGEGARMDETFVCCPICGGIAYHEELPSPQSRHGHYEECLYNMEGTGKD